MSDPATDIQKQNEVLNNDIRQDKNRYYDFHAYPENYGLEVVFLSHSNSTGKENQNNGAVHLQQESNGHIGFHAFIF